MSHSIPASVWVLDSLPNCLCTVFFDRRAGTHRGVVTSSWLVHCLLITMQDLRDSLPDKITAWQLHRDPLDTPEPYRATGIKTLPVSPTWGWGGDWND